MLVAGLLSSIVRAAMVGLAVGLFFLWWHRFRQLAHLAAPGLVFLLLLPPNVFGTFLSSTSLGQRSTGWSDTVDRILAAPFGNGIGATGSAAERTASLGGESESLYQPDNYYFKTVFELGPLGLWMLVLLLISAFLYALAVSRALHAVDLADAVGAGRPQSARVDPPSAADEADRQVRQDAALAAGIAATLLAGGAASVFATYLEIFPIDLHFWLFLGVLTSLAPGSSSALSPSALREAVSRPTSAS